jgi:VanZ family protein
MVTEWWLSRLRFVAACAAWACLVFVIYASLVPLYSRPVLTNTEPFSIVLLERIAAFAVLGFLFTISYPRRYSFIVVIVFGSAVVLEVLQILVPDRDARVLDAVEKLLGGGIGIGTAYWVLSNMPARLAALRRRSSDLL